MWVVKNITKYFTVRCTDFYLELDMAAAPPSAFMTSALPSGVEGAVQQCPWWIGVFMTAVPLVDRRVDDSSAEWRQEG